MEKEAVFQKIGPKTLEYVKKINEAIRRELELYKETRFYGPLLYATEGGKRVRPLILLFSNDAVGGKLSDALPAAVAVELLHTESIIHDDVIDEEISRRGRMAFHVKYGYDASLLSADFVFSIILNITSRYKDSRVASELASAALDMCEGELEELKVDPSICRLSWDEYIKVIQKKTASLFKTAARLGAIIGGASHELIDLLSEYGLMLGIAYQIHDDIQDWNSKGRLTSALSIVEDGQSALEYMNVMMRTYALRAERALRALKDSYAKDHLLSLLRLVISKEIV